MPLDSKEICGDWVEMNDESTGGEVVFRSINSDIPPARGRRRLVLGADGKVAGGAPGPDDRVRQGAQGRWSLHNDTLHIESGEWSGEYEVKQARPDRLVLRPV